MAAESGKRRTGLRIFLSTFVLWLLGSGRFSFEHPLLLVLGLASAALVTALCRRMNLFDEEALPVQLLLPRVPFYLPWLLVEIMRSSVDVLRRGLTPGFDLEPTVLTVEGSQRSDLGLVVYANSITLTPGTVSIDSDTHAHLITVHAIAEEDAEALREGDMDRWIRRLEGD